MAIKFEETIRTNALKNIAGNILIAARTAPKGRGIDNTVMAIVEKEDIKRLADKMIEIGTKCEHPIFTRDAKNISDCEILLLFGTKIKSTGLKKCGMCGFKNCDEKDKHPDNPCVFNTGDLGIAIGSAVSTAMNYKVDNRIMYTVGQAAMELKLMGDGVKIAYGLPLSATAKNIFFDRG
ncbi:MAG: DUF2148 domain-containing protein [Bacteroidales bacterium]|nr:DUF2148 domain-containing protein [Bacteroidales bacterium]